MISAIVVQNRTAATSEALTFPPYDVRLVRVSYSNKTLTKLSRHRSSPKIKRDIVMTSIFRPIAGFASPSLAAVALMSVTMLASPMTGARADSANGTAIQAAQTARPTILIAAGSTEMKQESVEQRITELHASLMITPNEESQWSTVAQVMRANAANMDKLAMENRATPPENRTAVDDLKVYERFARAHVDGLTNLLSSFEQLYAVMPDAQKKNADAVFQTFGHKVTASRS
jgi:LTXXQ motif family protein